MDKEVERVGWVGEVGKLDHNVCSVLAVREPVDGITSATNDTEFNGGYDIATNSETLPSDDNAPTNDLECDYDEDIDDCVHDDEC